MVKQEQAQVDHVPYFLHQNIQHKKSTHAVAFKWVICIYTHIEQRKLSIFSKPISKEYFSSKLSMYLTMQPEMLTKIWIQKEIITTESKFRSITSHNIRPREKLSKLLYSAQRKREANTGNKNPDHCK